MRTFDRVSFDLIYARPHQSVQGWRAELGEALAFGAGHLSLYQLTIEPATPFALLHKSGKLRVPDEELAAALYETTQELAEGAHLPAYEISNHARPGEEARHNLLYWRYGGYAGVGPGAHGRLTLGSRRYATQTEKLPERWLERVRTKGNGLVLSEELGNAEQAREHLLMGMRLAEGIDVATHETRFGVPLDRTRIAALADIGLLSFSGTTLAATPRGRLVLNSVIAALV
jgi:oxygen-independent coproporphyrinogen-3 oxidase